jgi:triosephosphate isomerase (TIM)
MSERRPLMAGNWKMNLTLEQACSLAAALVEHAAGGDDVDIMVAPPFTSLHAVRNTLRGSRVLLAGQNMHWEPGGAFTGEVSGGMLLEAGCSHVILGHSERRTLFGEDDEIVDRKVTAARDAGLIPILCIGETLEERDAGRTFQVIRAQLDGSLAGSLSEGEPPPGLVVAYEPVWAIGTGRTATPEQAREAHHFIRGWVEEKFGADAARGTRILYGGSVKPDNVRDLMAWDDIDGALVGGASLTADQFLPIVRFRDGGL